MSGGGRREMRQRTERVRTSVTEEAEHGENPKLARLKEISDRSSRLPVLDDRAPDEILGYDSDGMPDLEP